MHMLGPTILLGTILAILPIPTYTGVLCETSARVVQGPAATTLIITVTDQNGKPVNGLKADSFTVAYNKVNQEILELSQPDDPISMAILFDLSESLGGRNGHASKPILQALDALKTFIKLSHPSNEYTLIGFNDKAVLLRDRFQNSDATIKDIESIRNLPFKGGSALYDAIELGIKVLAQGTNPKRAIVLITDGVDSASQSTFNQIIKILARTSTLIYPVYPFSGESKGSSLDQEAQAILKEFAVQSGGRYVEANRSPDLTTFLEAIASEMRSQYVVRVRLTTATANNCSEVRVKVTSTVDAKLKSLKPRFRKIVCDS